MELYLRVLSVIDYYAHSTIQSNISALCVVHEWHSCVLRVLPTVLHKAIEIFFFFFSLYYVVVMCTILVHRRNSPDLFMRFVVS